MGLLRAIGRGARELGNRARFNGAGWGAALGAGIGGAAAMGNGGDAGDVGRSALIGGAMGAGGAMVSPLLGPAGALGAGAVGMMSTVGNVDAAARKIIQASRGDPANIQRAADLLYGANPTQDEMGYGRGGRSNVYGVSGSDQVGMSAINVERDQAVKRAYEMLGEPQL